VIDKGAGTVEVDGRAWLRRRFSVRRSLAEVAGVEVKSRFAGYGSRAYYVFLCFSDGSAVTVLSPAAATVRWIEERARELEAFVKPAS
jgi:hypothetical protein